MAAPVRALQVLGAAAFFVAGFLVVLHVTTIPQPANGTSVDFKTFGPPRRPIPETFAAIEHSARASDPRPAWQQRLWYPWIVAGFWLLAASWARRGARARYQSGAALLVLSLAILVLEAAYLYQDYDPFLPGTAGTVEGCGVFVFVVFLLLYRRPADRRVDALEATIASQAILGFAHLLTLPSTMARPWFAYSSPEAVTQAVLTNFRPPFWIACAALLLASVPVYLSRRRPAP